MLGWGQAELIRALYSALVWSAWLVAIQRRGFSGRGAQSGQLWPKAPHSGAFLKATRFRESLGLFDLFLFLFIEKRDFSLFNNVEGWLCVDGRFWPARAHLRANFGFGRFWPLYGQKIGRFFWSVLARETKKFLKIFCFLSQKILRKNFLVGFGFKTRRRRLVLAGPKKLEKIFLNFFHIYSCKNTAVLVWFWL